MHTIVATKTNLQYLCDVEVLLGLTCIISFLEVVHAFIKFAQAQDCFVCDFNTSVNTCCAELYMYFDPEKNNFMNTSRPSWTSMKALMTSSSLLGGQILQ